MSKWGLWAIDETTVRYYSDNWIQLSCEHVAINGERMIKNIVRTPLDRLLRRDFDAKVDKEIEQFVAVLTRRNDKILELRAKSNAAVARVRGLSE